MSLKHVHTAFIVGATLLAAMCATQAWERFRADGSPLMAIAAAAALGAAALLVRYEIRFLERCRREGIQ